MSLTTSVLARSLALAALALPAAAQVHTWTGVGTHLNFGLSVADAGDVDGDGCSDVLVGAPGWYDFLCFTFDSSSGVFLYSGADGAELWRFSDYHHEHLGMRVRSTDWNLDGVPDLLYARATTGCAFDDPGFTIRSTEILHTLEEYPFGWGYDSDRGATPMEVIGDADGDGREDIIVGNHAQARVVRGGSGGGGLTLRTFPGECLAVAGVGDWNGDGLEDVAIGRPDATRVYSVLDGLELLYLPVVGPLADPGDFDGDGTRDLIIGATVHSGADGSVLLDLPDWREARPAHDYDGDGRIELVASQWGSGPASVGVLSGADGSLAMMIWSGEAGHEGPDVATADVDGDGIPEIVVGIALQNSVQVFRGPCGAPPTNYCVGAPNSAGPGAHLGFEGDWRISSEFRLIAQGCPPGEAGVFFYAASAVQLPLGDGFLCAAGGMYRLMPIVTIGADGRAERTVDFDAPPAGAGPGEILPGSTWHFQLWYRDSLAGTGSTNLSDGLAVTFCD